MLISVVADSLYIRLVFRAQGGVTDTVRAVDISWKEAEQLRLALARVLYQDSERPAEEHSRWDLRGAEDER